MSSPHLEVQPQAEPLVASWIWIECHTWGDHCLRKKSASGRALTPPGQRSDGFQVKIFGALGPSVSSVHSFIQEFCLGFVCLFL